VFEGAVSLGFTPIGQRPLRPGRHVLRLVPSDGSPERRLVVDIRPGETTGQTVRFR
jgi:hypothetical protein